MDQIEGATEHIAWEYVSMLGAAREMARGPDTPLNHQVQEAFLVHVRNLAEFFCKGVAVFKPGTLIPRDQEWGDNIYAVDFCTSITWDPKPLQSDTKLRRAIDKTLSHLTYARDLRGPHVATSFDGRLHVHGTVQLVMKTWQDFRTSLPPKISVLLNEWLMRHAVGLDMPPDNLSGEFERLATQRTRAREWQLSTTPDGPVI